ncbi:MAG: hypothetical protein HYX96_07985 [Chloroflexi bacterium]|nr:hypothetical protein [Chloroflexota bacterium]
MKSSEEVGKLVAAMLKQPPRYPDEYRKNIMRLCRSNYGIEAYPLRHTRPPRPPRAPEAQKP